jgi:hypothetical protein
MAHIKINPSGVGQEATIPRRLIMAAMVQVKHASPLNAEQMVTDLMGKPGR